MRTKKGIVTSAKMEKTVVVTVHSYKAHPKYHKKYRVSSKFLAHDEKNEAKNGDVVVIQECRPLSKRKRWMVIENFGGSEFFLDEMEMENPSDVVQKVLEE